MGLVVVGLEQGFHHSMDLLGPTGFSSTHLVGQTLVISNIEPVSTAVGSSGLEPSVEYLDHVFRQFVLRMVDDVVDAAEVVCGLHDIIHVDR